MTAVPQPAFATTGFVVPDEADILTGVKSDLTTAFGNLNTDPETPQGQWAASLAELIGAGNDLFLQYVNQVDPAYSSGRMQDAIARLYFLTRNPAAATTVPGICSGLTGTYIPAGSLAQASDGNLYSAITGGTIPASGSVTLLFQCTATGPVACPAGSLSTVYRQVSGWDGVINTVAGTAGRDAEGRAAFEARRAASVAINAIGTFPSVRAAVLNVAGVTDAYVTENNGASAATIGGVSIAAHSLYAAVAGGADADVARAIWTKKNPGCGYTGNTTVVVTDTNSGYASPQPTYNVTFTRPTALNIAVAVTITNATGVPADATAQVQAAVAGAFPAQAKIGATVYAARLVAAVAALGTWAQQIVSITVNGANDVTANINQLPTLTGTTLTLA